MSLFRSNKQDGPPDPGPEDDRSAGLHELAEHLGQLGRMVGEVNQDLTAFLLEQAGEPAPAQSDAATLLTRLDALGEKLDALLQRPAAGAAPGLQGDVAGSMRLIVDRLDALAARWEQAERAAQEERSGQGPNLLEQQIQRLDGRLEQVLALLQPPAAEEAPAPAAGSAEWQRAILGAELVGMPNLAFQRQQLIDGVLAGDPAACELAGQLLVFRSSTPERMPQVLKDVGEAFYRWQPRTAPGATPLEESLARWLKRSCESAGISNTIELVHPGQRFDAARHSSASRGVEIVAVQGWIVLRDNGRVYTKALVGVR